MARNASGIPDAGGFDSTLLLFREGYLFISNRCDQLDSDAFRTRLMLKKVVCMRGREAAREFYRPDRMTRRGAMPRSTFTLLQDWGSVQTLDGTDHRRRKEMFMGLMGAAPLDCGGRLFAEEWRRAIEALGPGTHRIVLHDFASIVLARAALRWCGLPLEEGEAERRRQEFVSAIEHTASFGPGFLRAQRLRQRSEKWARNIMERIRDGKLAVDDDMPAATIAAHCDNNDKLLPVPVAAVELLNLLRPITAVARFITFAAHAMHLHREWRARLRTAGEVRNFVQEVRRFYPFFPFVAGRVLEPFLWQGHRFQRQDWVILDLYGTNHDKAGWREPEHFDPDRFEAADFGANGLIPQGGGDFASGHRCPGEWLTLSIMDVAVQALARLPGIVPAQDLSIRLNRFPALPASGMALELTA